MKAKILLVDDDPNILSAYKRQMRKHFEIDVATRGPIGLQKVAKSGPYTVVIADMQMPGMDGIEFLSLVRDQAPETVRIMLTGNADLQTAMDAVNQGHIFRFLTKPCSPEVLRKTTQAGVGQYQLIMTEKELLEKTLSGSVKVLTEVLSLVNPTAFSSASRIKRYTQHIAVELHLPDVWQFELAAMLSQIGCVTLPSEILEKVYEGKPLSAEEEKLYRAHPEIGSNLLKNIPRLETTAEMIEAQFNPDQRPQEGGDIRTMDRVSLGTQILKVASEFDKRLARDVPAKTILMQLRRDPVIYVVAIIDALESYEVDQKLPVTMVAIHQLTTRMTLAEDVFTKNELLLVTKGQEVTYAVLGRLRAFARGVGVVEPIKVIDRSPISKTRKLGHGPSHRA